MNRIVSLLFTVVSSFPVLVVGQSVAMNFQIESFEEDTIYVGNHFGKNKYLVDTIKVEGGAFSFVKENPKPGIYFLYTPKYYFEFVVDGSSFDMRYDKSAPYESMKIEGSDENVFFRDFQVKMGKLQREQIRFAEQLKSANPEDSIKIIAEMRILADKVKSTRREIIQDQPDSFVSSFLSLLDEPVVPTMEGIDDEKERSLSRYLYFKSHFLTAEQVSDFRLLRTPLIHEKVMKYFDNAVVQHPDSIIQEVDWFLDLVKDDEESDRYWLVTLFQKYSESKQMGMDAVMVHIIENYYLTGRAHWITDEYTEKLRDEVAFVKPNLIGKRAPEIVAVDIDMNPFDIEMLAAEHFLVFIYDPDCGHCKKTVKKLEEVEEKLANLGVEVIALCTTTDVERWKTFVESTNPNWNHCIDPTGKSYFRVSYNVRSTPKIYLLDESKTIIAKKLDIDQFIEIVESRLNR
ncbi:MAG: redoxin domain-containing protein [Cyclobacteriaceae bacterium]